jgi:hypothetical protein
MLFATVAKGAQPVFGQFLGPFLAHFLAYFWPRFGPFLARPLLPLLLSFF